MEDDNLLDDTGILQDQSILDMIQWWEKRRLLYNVIVGLSGILTSIIIMKLHRSIAFSEILWYAVLPYGIFSNLAYLVGWVFELLLRYYFKIKLNLSSRRTLLGVGIAISILPFIFIILIILG